jgi:hypothetical protein
LRLRQGQISSSASIFILQTRKKAPAQIKPMTAPATIAMAAAGTPVAAAPPIIMLLDIIPVVIMPVAVPVAFMVPVPVDIMDDIIDVPEPSVPPTALLLEGVPTAALAALFAKSICVSPELHAKLALLQI